MGTYDIFFASTEDERLDFLHNEFLKVQKVRSLQEEAGAILKELENAHPEMLARYKIISDKIKKEEASHFYRSGLNDGVLLGMLLPGIKSNSKIKIV